MSDTDAPRATVETPIPEDLAIVTEGLTKIYGSVEAVSELDMSVPSGSIYGLIGPNGAGKTTALLILATLLKPTSGSARVCGYDLATHLNEVRGVLGYMPDFFGVYDDVRVGEYLDFFASAYRLAPARRERKVSDLLQLVGLSHKADSFVESLSRGMKQRLGLARALVHDPRVLILDEPASGLDPRARVEFRELVLELKATGKTVLISSHILSELEEVCTHIGILEEGRLLAQGPPADILSGIRAARTFRVRLVDPADEPRALEVLALHKAVSAPSCANGMCEFFFAGNNHDAADLLGRLTAADLKIVEFAETRAGLQELFMGITKGLVQ